MAVLEALAEPGHDVTKQIAFGDFGTYGLVISGPWLMDMGRCGVKDGVVLEI